MPSATVIIPGRDDGTNTAQRTSGRTKAIEALLQADSRWYFSACGRTASHFDSRRGRLHRRRVPEAAGFFSFPQYLVAMMEVL
jgi:hypothetical protein